MRQSSHEHGRNCKLLHDGAGYGRNSTLHIRIFRRVILRVCIAVWPLCSHIDVQIHYCKQSCELPYVLSHTEKLFLNIVDVFESRAVPWLRRLVAGFSSRKKQFRFQVIPCRICDRRYGIETDNCPETSAIPYTDYSMSPSLTLHDFSNSGSLNYTLHKLGLCQLNLSLNTL